MALSKRFTDTGVWSKPWFRQLDPAQKVGWFYIKDNCDNVGVWDGDKQLAEFCIGCPVEWDDLLDNCNGNLQVLPNGKWWVVDYCRFQHGDLFSQKRSRVLDSYLELLEKHGLTETVRQQFANCSQTVQGKGLGKGEGKGVGEEREYAEGVRLEPCAYSALVAKYGDTLVNLAIEKVSAQQIKTKKRYPSPRGAIVQWGIRAAEEELQRAKGKGVKDTRPSGPPLPSMQELRAEAEKQAKDHPETVAEAAEKAAALRKKMGLPVEAESTAVDSGAGERPEETF